MNRKIVWEGAAKAERGLDAKTGDVLVAIDERYYRPTEVEYLLGDPAKARRLLGWSHKITFDRLVSEMVDEDMKTVRNEQHRKNRHD